MIHRGRSIYEIGVWVGLAEVEDAGFEDWQEGEKGGHIWAALNAESRGQFLEFTQKHLWNLGLRAVRFSSVSLLRNEDVLAPSTEVELLASRADKTRQVELADKIDYFKADKE